MYRARGGIGQRPVCSAEVDEQLAVVFGVEQLLGAVAVGLEAKPALNRFGVENISVCHCLQCTLHVHGSLLGYSEVV